MSSCVPRVLLCLILAFIVPSYNELVHEIDKLYLTMDLDNHVDDDLDSAYEQEKMDLVNQLTGISSSTEGKAEVAPMMVYDPFHPEGKVLDEAIIYPSIEVSEE